MSKKRRAPEEVLDMNEALRGLIPWTRKEYNEVLSWYIELLQTPMDQWVKPELGVRISDYEGNITNEYRLNFLMPEIQLLHHLHEKYASQPAEIATAHFLRWCRIKRFLQENQAALTDAGLIIRGETHSQTSNTLLEVLCKLPFTGEKIEEGEKSYVFSYKRVMREVRNILSRGRN